MTIIRGYKLSRREPSTSSSSSRIAINPSMVEHLVCINDMVISKRQYPKLLFFGPAISLHFAIANHSHFNLDWLSSLVWPRPTLNDPDKLLCWARPIAGHVFSIHRCRIPIFSTNKHARLAPLATYDHQTTIPISLVTDPTSVTKDELALWTLSESLENLNA